jgi:uncharacterized protein YcbK (DUF882 family)
MLTDEPAWMWPHFSPGELTCPCGCDEMRIDEIFMARLERLRYRVNRPLPITSGYRCTSYNNTVSITGPDGPHTTGHAVDIAISGVDVPLLVRHALQTGLTGIGLKQHGPHAGRFVHLDDLSGEGWPRPRIWSYR